MSPRISRRMSAAALLTTGLVAATALPSRAAGEGDGVVRLRSIYPMAETIDRLKKDVAAKGIMFFSEIDQAKLAADANIRLPPSTLLIFGNPPLGTQFITAKPQAGLDWPVRLLVFQDAAGAVWMAYTDFAWIAHRHGIKNREPQFKMASEVIASITSAATK
ncbi:MAG TPA: DUF302 domain-containing protein [Vineibacter sp.]|nr:DUF302 domain-containing protein [Vineibacter sp.]